MVVWSSGRCVLRWGRRRLTGGGAKSSIMYEYGKLCLHILDLACALSQLPPLLLPMPHCPFPAFACAHPPCLFPSTPSLCARLALLASAGRRGGRSRLAGVDRHARRQGRAEEACANETRHEPHTRDTALRTHAVAGSGGGAGGRGWGIAHADSVAVTRRCYAIWSMAALQAPLLLAVASRLGCAP